MIFSWIERVCGRLRGLSRLKHRPWASAMPRGGPLMVAIWLALRRAASKARAPASPTHNGSSNPTDPPIREPPHRRGERTTENHKAARAHGQGRISPRPEPHKARASWPTAPENSRGQPAAVVVRERGAKPPSHTNAYRAELSPRNLHVGVAIAIGPSRENPARLRVVKRSSPLVRVHSCNNALPQHLSIARNNLHTAIELSALQKLQSKSVPAAVREHKVVSA